MYSVITITIVNIFKTITQLYTKVYKVGRVFCRALCPLAVIAVTSLSDHVSLGAALLHL